MTGLRDYDAWHRGYDDPDSGLSWRLRRVQQHLVEALDARPGPVGVVSACAGDGRDLVEVLASRADAHRVRATLLELHPVVAARARDSAKRAGLGGVVEVREVDAGRTSAYAGLVPADVVLLVGILGNLSGDDRAGLLAAAPQLCTPGARLLWSRGLEAGGTNDDVRAGLAAAGFTELDYAEHPEEGCAAALGLVRYDGPPVPLVPDRHLFTFLR